jgi:hypothetical protein
VAMTCRDGLIGEAARSRARRAALLCARKLRAVNAELVEKNEAYERELADDAAPRERRDEAAATLSTEVMKIRDALTAAYGAAIVRELGLDGKTDTEPKAILAKAKRLARDLKDPERRWPKPRCKGIEVDPSAWIDDLEGPIAVLEKAQTDVAREVRIVAAFGDKKIILAGAEQTTEPKPSKAG